MSQTSRSPDDFLRGLVAWTMDMRRRMEKIHYSANKILFPEPNWKERYDEMNGTHEEDGEIKLRKPQSLTLEELEL